MGDRKRNIHSFQIERMTDGDPTLAGTLAVYYAEMAKAQAENNLEAVEYAKDAIREALRPLRKGPIDAPLFPLRRPKTRKSTKR